MNENPTPRRVRVTGSRFHPVVPDGAEWVGRPAPYLPGSRYQNRHPVGACRFHIEGHPDQASAVIAFAHDLEGDPDLVAAARSELAGRDLACRCKTEPCHASLLLLVVAGAEPLDALSQLGLEEYA